MQCDQCDKQNHINCVEISSQKYEKLKYDPLPWLCSAYIKEIPFSNLLNKDLSSVLFQTNTNYQGSKGTLQNNLDEKSTESLKQFREINELLDHQENSISCDYYTPHEFKKLKIRVHDLSILHLNISSLSSHIDNLKMFLAFQGTIFDIICISERRLFKITP